MRATSRFSMCEFLGVPFWGRRGDLRMAKTGETERRTEPVDRDRRPNPYWPRMYANISGATIEASDSMTNRGVAASSLPHVIFSLGTAPLYDPYDVVLSEIWQK